MLVPNPYPAKETVKHIESHWHFLVLKQTLSIGLKKITKLRKKKKSFDFVKQLSESCLLSMDMEKE